MWDLMGWSDQEQIHGHGNWLIHWLGFVGRYAVGRKACITIISQSMFDCGSCQLPLLDVGTAGSSSVYHDAWESLPYHPAWKAARGGGGPEANSSQAPRNGSCVQSMYNLGVWAKTNKKLSCLQDLVRHRVTTDIWMHCFVDRSQCNKSNVNTCNVLFELFHCTQELGWSPKLPGAAQARQQDQEL